ncbi:MAG: antibiotic biosynthesis monooxygenase [Betaproteobacteria bacterium]|nr:antibiotic biosynthesis monooxygenase [Betaproteobacteria bacterium]
MPQRSLRSAPAARIGRWRTRGQPRSRATLEAEPGCERFDVHQSKDDRTLFFLIEVYADQAALDAHRVAPHCLQFRVDTVDRVTDRKWWFWDPLGP